MKKKLLHITLLGLMVCQVHAQDTLPKLLPTVTVQASRDAWWTPGKTQLNFDSLHGQMQKEESVSESISALATIHLREYSPGSVASFSSRGASSAQNAILWNGYNINSSGTGLTDLSLLNSGFYTMVQSPGGAAPQFGSGAMGSVLSLYQRVPEKPFSLSFRQKIGSFGQYASLASFSWRKEKIWFSSKISQATAENNFEYRNPLNGQVQQRTNAAFQQASFSQTIGVQSGKHHSLEAEAFYTYGFRETPNNTLVQKDGTATLNDQILRSRIDWNYEKKRSSLRLGYAFLNEWQEFQDPYLMEPDQTSLRDTNSGQSHIAKIDYQVMLRSKWTATAGWQMRYDKVDGSNRYGTQTVHSLFSGMRYGYRKYVAAIYVRSEILDGVPQAVMPQISGEWTPYTSWKISGRAGRHYRLPTLNDKYWNPGGNQSLLPETGQSAEVALNKMLRPAKNQSIKISLAGHMASINDYILWLPGANGIFTPQNLRSVGTKGGEFTADYHIKSKRSSLQMHLESAYVSATVNTSHLEDDRSVGQQLVYQPKWKHSGFLSWEMGRNILTIEQSYISSVSTNYSGGSLDAFYLTHLSFARNFEWDKTRWQLSFTCRNVLDKQYETIPYFPMPGRNFLILLSLEL